MTGTTHPPPPRPSISSGARRGLALLALFTALTVGTTWPQARYMATHAADHHDVYFNMWRLAWFAHVLWSSPSELFDANIFYPERNTLTFSDAMIVEGALAAPLLWAGVRPVLVHNLLLFAAMIASGLGMYVLSQRLTGSRAAGTVAGIMFACAPFRFEHYMHLELQWITWTPWVLLAVHRTIETGRRADGIRAGALVALQMLSSIYYGVFLATILPFLSALLLVRVPGSRARRAIQALALGAGIAAVVCSLYAIPYLSTRQHVGARSTHDIDMFSAKPSDYLVATPENRVYGQTFSGRSERRLFPGMLPLLLALMAFVLRRPAPNAVAYLIAMVLAFEMSLGLGGYTYRFLSERVPLFDGLRAVARLGIFVVMFLAIVAGFGYVALRDVLPAWGRRVMAVAIPAVLLAEYFVAPLELVPYDNAPPPVYRFLARLPPGVVAEFPMPRRNALPGPDPRYTYMSTFHWKPLVNGYSGFHPSSYLERLGLVERFPEARSLNVLRRTGVTYLVVHLSSYRPDEASRVLLGLDAAGAVVSLGTLHDGVGQAVVYRLD
jgi:hypothetical protein